MGEPIQIRATLKRATGRPARDPGDKPVFGALLRAEVNPITTSLLAKLGKDATVTIAFDPDPQESLPGFGNGSTGSTRTTTVDRDLSVVDTHIDGDGEESSEAEAPTTPLVIPPAGRRRNGTRSTEQVPPAERPVETPAIV